MRRPPAMAASGWLAALTAIIALLGALPAEADSGPAASAELIAAGKRLYREGRTINGELLQAVIHNDVPMRGEGLACTNCHRRSGLGSSEGGIGIPPIVGNTLFSAQTNSLVRDYRNGELSNISRPAYTTQALAHVLREGVNSAGQTMRPMMPRYAISDEDVAAIAAYLATLSAAPAEGITEHDMHFATVVTPDASAGERQAMLDVMNAYFARKNGGTRNEARRAERAPFHREWMYSAYRTWVLHEWTLSGPADTWASQLEAHYRRQPVFALLGGIGRGNWQPVHNFCEHHEVPCLFPHLAAPPPHAERDFYSVYFSRGLLLEAGALAAHLTRSGRHNARVLQVLRPNPETMAAASALRAALSTTGDDHLLVTRGAPDGAYWMDLLQRTQAEVLVLWLDANDLAGLAAITAAHNLPAAAYVSSTLLPEMNTAALSGLGIKNLLHPFQLPGKERPLARFHIWARQSGIELREQRVQADAYFAVTLAGEALMHIRGNLSREYLIERIEHMTDSMLYTSTYPRLSLAPGQRYAAKGAYVWHLDQGPETAEWIVP